MGKRIIHKVFWQSADEGSGKHGSFHKAAWDRQEESRVGHPQQGTEINRTQKGEFPWLWVF
jgi:hypothetical protein